MAKTIQAIRGMNDCSPTESPLWQWVESKVRNVLQSYGYSEFFITDYSKFIFIRNLCILLFTLMVS
ncbi:hypothetical protein Z012_10875 [Avibacterium paragallinarum]|nr:hypothetical protein Z012_10875 [Avibacterium paragallinarum]